MLKRRVFGKIPENYVLKSGRVLNATSGWQFVDNRDGKHPSKNHHPTNFISEIVQEEIADFRKELSEVSSDEIGETISIDLPLTLLGATTGQNWVSGGQFGNRNQALRQLKVDPANQTAAGEDVGVIILDAGFNRKYIEALAGPGRYGGGWSNQSDPAQHVGNYLDPHKRASDGHGNMIARNILSIAPKATLYDVPILPSQVYNLNGFSSDVVGALESIRHVIENAENHPCWPKHKHWILVNAWAVATSFADHGQIYSYANSREHILNKQIIELAEMDHIDVVFAAGNAGVFQPAPFSGPYDRGHAHSIWGANGLEEVFTIGAVRTDGIAVGASSQGPSRKSLLKPGNCSAGTNKKPDLCAPSWFSEDCDASVANTGTSAACALFAGMLADIRSGVNTQSSDALKASILNAASNADAWNAQTGYGMPDLGGM